MADLHPAIRKLAWAIQTRPGSGLYLGVGYFDWRYARPGLTTMTFATRAEARAAITPRLRSRYAFPKARERQVRISVEAARG